MSENLLAKPKKLNRVVIKEELVALTGDFKLAIVLNQMIYWSERRSDADKFISEEIERFKHQSLISDEGMCINPIQPAHGWIYKKAEELVSETMIGSSAKTMLSYLNALVEKGWLQKRKNPRYDFDRTYQYRVDLFKIQTDLFSLGYCLEGYDLGEVTVIQNANTNLQNENSIESASEDNDILEITALSSNLPFENTYCKNVNTNLQNVRAIPETTITETTITETTEINLENNNNNNDSGSKDSNHNKKIENEGVVVDTKIIAIKDIFFEYLEKSIPEHIVQKMISDGLNLEQIRKIAFTLKSKMDSGQIKNPLGLLISNPDSVIHSIMEGSFYPDRYNDERDSSMDESLAEEIIEFQKLTGIDMKPAARQKIFFKWKNEFSSKMILKAGEIMCLYTRAGGLEYVDSILQSWLRKEINNLEAVEKDLMEFKKKNKKSPKKPNNTEYTESKYELYVPPDVIEELKNQT